MVTPSPQTLSEREKRLLDALDKWGISDTPGKYYCPGGNGTVQVRYHPKTLPKMQRLGWAEYSRGYWRISEFGRELLKNSRQS